MAIGDVQRTQSLADRARELLQSAATDTLVSSAQQTLSEPVPQNRLAQGIAARAQKRLQDQREIDERTRQIQQRINNNPNLRSDIESLDKEGRDLAFIDNEINTRLSEEVTQERENIGHVKILKTFLLLWRETVL